MAAQTQPDQASPFPGIAAAGGPLMPATAQIMLASWHRCMALQAEWFEETVRRARNHRDLPTLQRPVTDWTEPALRYAIGMLALGRSTQDQWTCLSSASLRGASAEVSRLAESAREQASLASKEAGSATQSAWSCWLQGLQMAPSTASQPGMPMNGQGAPGRHEVNRSSRPRRAPRSSGSPSLRQ
jgi:hypothetical protein